jgi:hypothetical protein
VTGEFHRLNNPSASSYIVDILLKVQSDVAKFEKSRARFHELPGFFKQETRDPERSKNRTADILRR